MRCEARIRPNGKLRAIYDDLLIRIFVDSVWLHKYWGCHRKSNRCFFVRGRQFHICARCTGLLVGLPLSLLLIPFRIYVPVPFFAFSGSLLIDGITQSMGLRESNNTLRFITGFGTALTALPFLIWSIRSAI